MFKKIYFKIVFYFLGVKTFLGKVYIVFEFPYEMMVIWYKRGVSYQLFKRIERGAK